MGSGSILVLFSNPTPIQMSLPITAFQLSLRARTQNADHHLWNNHGTWWCHFTLHCSMGTKRRVRRSLRTRNLLKARQRRDALLCRLQTQNVSAQERSAA